MKEAPIFSVTQLNQQAKYFLEDCFPAIWVEGEISNFSAPASGHWYFSLKDSGAQIRSAMFRGQNRLLAFTPTQGMQVVVKAKVTLYEERGDFQLIVSDMQEAGLGKLQRQFEALKKTLLERGWFDPTHKKPLPSFPKQIGVITSATGAAIHDILKVLKKRCPLLSVIIYPTLVQGADAAASIARALQWAIERSECEVLILARGGGSLEDLWPFNEEILARAIFECPLPLVTGIGHEVDFTIADFVADLRAPTPSAAAEAVSPDLAYLQKEMLSLTQGVHQRIQAFLQGRQKDLRSLMQQLERAHPRRLLETQIQRLDFLRARLDHAFLPLFSSLQHRFNLLVQALHHFSPLATLARGYAIARKNGRVLGEDCKLGDQIEVETAQLILQCEVMSLQQRK